MNAASAEAARRKARESAGAIEAFFAAEAERIAACAEAMARAFDGGARLFTTGNGGSFCDAQHAAVEFLHPIHEKRKALPALALGGDPALMSAIANDQDFALAVTHQLRMLARPGDVVLAISTSGKSASVVRAVKAAREIGALTVGLAGGDGGKLAEHCDHAFVVPSFSIHRVQEVHAVLVHVLWDLVHLARGEEDVL